jgi:pimeloyl-ACP methyl ester carboxylesterase
VAPLGLWLDEERTPDIFGLTPGALTRALFADPQSAAAASFNRNDPDPIERNAAILRRRQALIAAAKLLWPLPDKGLKNRLYRIAAPALLVWGTHDRIATPAYASAFGALIAGASMRTVQAGHMLPQEAPAEIADAVHAFMMQGTG